MTLGELTSSSNFQGLFQFQFGEEFQKLLPLEDFRFVSDVTLSFNESHDGWHFGRFVAHIETTEGLVIPPVEGIADPDAKGPMGETRGSFRVHLRHGLDGAEAKQMLDEAVVEIVIEHFPRVQAHEVA